jgi:PTH1 family peptidyl-tRNA hydrolase
VSCSRCAGGGTVERAAGPPRLSSRRAAGGHFYRYRCTVMSGVPLKLIVGLGNPGPEYARTRHNAGFILVDQLASRYGGTFRSEPRHHGDLAKVRVDGAELWLLKPMSFMNRSGGPVHSVAGFYKVPAESILVAYDELDFPPGVIKLKQGGGAAGHNGMRDVIAQMGDQFWRLRIGIGHPGDRAAVLNYVLGRPSAEDSRLIDEAIGAGLDAVSLLLADGGQKAMHRLHTRNVPPGGSPPTA